METWFGRKRIPDNNGNDSLEASVHVRVPLGGRGGKGRLPPALLRLLVALGTLAVVLAFVIELIKTLKDLFGK